MAKRKEVLSGSGGPVVEESIETQRAAKGKRCYRGGLDDGCPAMEKLGETQQVAKGRRCYGRSGEGGPTINELIK